MDDKNVRRRFRASNYQVCPYNRLIAIEHNQSQAVHMHHAHETWRRLEPDPVQLVRLHEEGLRNQLHRNAEVSVCSVAVWSNGCLFRVQIHANCRIRRIYFSDRLYTEDELPPEFKLFLPIAADRNTAGGAGATGPNNQMMK